MCKPSHDRRYMSYYVNLQMISSMFCIIIMSPPSPPTHVPTCPRMTPDVPPWLSGRARSGQVTGIRGTSGGRYHCLHHGYYMAPSLSRNSLQRTKDHNKIIRNIITTDIKVSNKTKKRRLLYI